MMGHVLTYNRLKALSFLHSAIYLGLLIVWIIPGLAGATFVLGMAHGIGWIVMVGLALLAVTMSVVPFWLGVTIAIVGAVGPFAGSAGFIVHDRRADAAQPHGATA
jgi:hypothetical protein